MDRIVYLLSLVCIIQINLVLVESLSCYSCSKNRGLPSESECINETCVFPKNTSCEVRVTRLNKTKRVLDAQLRCAVMTDCERAGTGCNATPNPDQESCGVCCKGDNCNKLSLATFTNLNECTEKTDICGTGNKCTNIDGGYFCTCNPGFTASADRRSCIDAAASRHVSGLLGLVLLIVAFNAIY